MTMEAGWLCAHCKPMTKGHAYCESKYCQCKLCGTGKPSKTAPQPQPRKWINPLCRKALHAACYSPNCTCDCHESYEGAKP